MSTLEEAARRRLIVAFVATILCLVQIATLLSGKISLGEQSVFYDMDGDVVEFLRRQYPGRLGYAQDLYEFFDGSDNVTLVVDDAVFRIERDTTPTAWMELSPTLVPAVGGVSEVLFCSKFSDDELKSLTPAGPPSRTGLVSDFFPNGQSSADALFLLRRPLPGGDDRAIVISVDQSSLPLGCQPSLRTAR